MTAPSSDEMNIIPDEGAPTLQSEASPIFKNDFSSSTADDSPPLLDSMTSRYTPPPKNYKLDPNSSFDFPMSAGEAGTAIFGIEELKNQNPGIAMERPSTQQELSVHISTPHKAFQGKVKSCDHKDIVIVSETNLLPGEEVRLKFELPQTKQRIDCRALVRSLSNEANGEPSLTIRFLDLRPNEEKMITEELAQS